MVDQSTKNRSGIEDDDELQVCTHPEHMPPTHISIPQGKRYRHVCPGCGAELVLRPIQVRF